MPWRSQEGPTASAHDPDPAFFSGHSCYPGIPEKVILPLFSHSQKLMEGTGSGDLYVLFYHFPTGFSVSSSVKWTMSNSPCVVMTQ